MDATSTARTVGVQDELGTSTERAYQRAAASGRRPASEARDSGHSSAFIAHNIHGVFQVVDRIVALRNGRVAADDVDPRRSSIADVEGIITGAAAA